MSKALVTSSRAPTESHSRLDTDLDAVLAKVEVASPLGATPSGRRIALRRDGSAEVLEVSNPSGRLELSVRFTPEGPVLSFEAARISLVAPDIDVRCDRLRIDASATVETRAGADIVSVAGGMMRQRAADDLTIDGKNVLINC